MYHEGNQSKEDCRRKGEILFIYSVVNLSRSYINILLLNLFCSIYTSSFYLSSYFVLMKIKVCVRKAGYVKSIEIIFVDENDPIRTRTCDV